MFQLSRCLAALHSLLHRLGHEQEQLNHFPALSTGAFHCTEAVAALDAMGPGALAAPMRVVWGLLLLQASNPPLVSPGRADRMWAFDKQNKAEQSPLVHSCSDHSRRCRAPPLLLLVFSPSMPM